VAGAVNFKGVAYIGHGSKISVTSSGTLTFGDGVTFNAESSVACTKRIDFGAGCMISWQVQIMDSDLHKVVSTLDLRHLNPDEPVDIGEHVWLGSRVTVLKGTRIGTGSVVATGAVCAGDLSLGNAVYGGVPARMIRKGVAWQR
jgi:acetyltransferase-like isoleucine patch superfamily enzyme